MQNNFAFALKWGNSLIQCKALRFKPSVPIAKLNFLNIWGIDCGGKWVCLVLVVCPRSWCWDLKSASQFLSSHLWFVQLLRCAPKIPEGSSLGKKKKSDIFLLNVISLGKKKISFPHFSKISWKRLRSKQRFACYTSLNVARNGFFGVCAGVLLWKNDSRESPGVSSQHCACGFGFLFFFPLVFLWSWLDKWELCVRRVFVLTQQSWCGNQTIFKVPSTPKFHNNCLFWVWSSISVLLEANFSADKCWICCSLLFFLDFHLSAGVSCSVWLG